MPELLGLPALLAGAPLPPAVASGVLLLLCALFTLVVARFVASFLRRVSPPPAMAAPPPPPAQCGELTLEQLRAFDGSDPSKPLYIVRGRGRGEPCVGAPSACSCRGRCARRRVPTAPAAPRQRRPPGARPGVGAADGAALGSVQPRR
jgi:hypothetical protein